MPRSFVLLLSASACALLAVPASAQQSPTQNKVEEIIVTARKRGESIIKAPVVETVVTQKALDQFSTHDIKNLVQLVPTLLVGSNLGAFGAQVAIRGVGNTTTNATIDQAVSLNLDGLQVNQGLAYAAGMFDLARAEVLEGPQALFYGKSATGGVISLQSNDPTNEIELTVQGGYEPVAGQRKGELIVSGPVSDTLKLRLAASYSDQDGYFHNIAQGQPLTGSENPRFRTVSPDAQTLIRGTAIWQPTDKLNFRLKLNYDQEDINGNDGSQEITSCPSGLAPFPGLPAFLNPNGSCSVSKNISIVDLNPANFVGLPNGGTPFNNNTEYFGTLESNYHLPDQITLTSVTGYFRNDEADLFVLNQSGAAGPLFALNNSFTQHEFSEEVRANSDFKGPLNFTAGVFYQVGQAQQHLNAPFNSALVPGLPYFQKGYFTVDNQIVSPFGQLRYKILPKVELAAGARWSDERKTVKEVSEFPRFGSLGNITVPVGIIPTGVPTLNSYHLDPEFTVTYTPTNDLTLYGSYKEASKSGSFQTTLFEPAGTDLSFKDELAKGGEIGAKGYLLERRLRFTIDGYYYQYTNLQVGEDLNTSDGLIVKTINAGTADIWGLEFAGEYVPDFVNGLTLHGALNFNQARFGTFHNAPCWGGQTIAQGCTLTPNPILIDPVTNKPEFTTQSLDGRPLMRAPDWTANFGFDYARPISGGMSIDIASNTSFSSSYYTDQPERSDMIQKAYFKTNLSVALHGPNDRWEVAVIGNNLGDVLTTGFCANAQYRTGGFPAGQITGGTTSGPPGPDELGCNIDPGRQVWLQLTLHYH